LFQFFDIGYQDTTCSILTPGHRQLSIPENRNKIGIKFKAEYGLIFIIPSFIYCPKVYCMSTVNVLMDFITDGNSNLQGGSLTFGGFDLYISPMLLDDSLGDKQPQAGTLFSFGGKKHIKYL
jgi:hypothetical protein